MTEPGWLPAPRRFRLTGGSARWGTDEAGSSADVARQVADQARSALAAARTTAACWSGRTEAAPVDLRLDPRIPTPAQGFLLTVEPGRAILEARDTAGLFYGAGALERFIVRFGARPPCCRIEDAPDFPVRGFMLDISRDKVPTMESLYRLVDLLASFRLNQLQLYTEHTFAYSRHRVVWEHADPMTPDQVRALDAYCADRFVELVPNQNSFGHLQRWLVHAPYRHLAECHGPFPLPWGGTRRGPFSLDPTQPGSLALVQEWYDELLPCFRSRWVNVGCDETFDLGIGRSREACLRLGKGRVYLDFLLGIHRAVERCGSRMMFWGDIVLGYPDLVPELPDDSIALNWGYEANHPFDRECARFAESGKAFYVCPGTSSWNALVGRTANALDNLDRAAEQGRAWGAGGYLITDWGDNGHWQPFPVSLPPLVAGAALAWCRESYRPGRVVAALDDQVFRDRAGVLGRTLWDLGEVYRCFRTQTVNRSWLHTLLAHPDLSPFAGQVQPEEAETAREKLSELANRLDRARPEADDGTVVVREVGLAAQLAAYGCSRWLAETGRGPRPSAADLDASLDAYQQLWLRRNRPGGLADSLARFEPVRRYVDGG